MAGECLLQLSKVQIKCQKHNRQNDSHDRKRRDGEECIFRNGCIAQLEDPLGDGDDVVLPLDCQTVRACEI